MVREYQEEYFTRIGVVVDTDARAASPAHIEGALSLAAGVVAHLCQGEALVDLLVELTDSAGHKETDSQTFLTLPAGGRSAQSHSLFLNVDYVEPGEVGVTIRLTVSAAGAVVDTFFAECSLVVREP